MQIELEHFFRVERFLSSFTDLDRLLAAIIRESSRAVSAESASLALYDDATEELYFYVAAGGDEEREFERKLKRFRMQMGSGIVGSCAASRETINCEDAYSDPRFDNAADKATGFVTRTILAVPMVRRKKLVGVVEAVNSESSNGFSEHDERVLSFLATQAALAVENARLYQENLRQARLTALGQGIAGAAHCIKNILNAIDGGAYILESGLRKDKMANVTKGWDILKRNTRMMKELVLDMLTYSKQREPEYEMTDVNGVCSQVADLVTDKARAIGVAVVTDFQDDMPKFALDPKGIYRSVLNLASNAVDACPEEGGEVRLATRLAEDGKTAAVQVCDNGCGISPETQKKLFRAFFSTKGSKGTGLGLAVTQKIIQEHGGDIALDSTVGEGTTFTITLPVRTKQS